MSTRPGAEVARARLAAALGRPIPTKQVTLSRRARAAETVIISSEVYAAALSSLPAPPVWPSVMAFVVTGTSFFRCRPHGMCSVNPGFQPALETVAVAADRVPCLVVAVDAFGVAERVGRVGAAAGHGHIAHRPRRQDHGVGPRVQPVPRPPPR